MSTAPTRVPRRAQRVSLKGDRPLLLRDRPLIMGVLNVTPDSFSDGGRYSDLDQAVGRAVQMVVEGAEILDIGAESTRPGGGVYGAGAQEITEEEELRRLIPVIESIRSRLDIPVSVDTRRSRVAEIALAAGADLVNDVSALSDPDMPAVVMEAASSIVVMHSRGALAQMQRGILFKDVVAEVVAELALVVDRAVESGIERHRLLVDPGIGFGKRTDHNLQLLRCLDSLDELGLPILVGASRKSFIGDLTGAPVSDRLPGSLAALAWAAHHRVAMVRVHDVAESAQFLTLWTAIESACTDTEVQS